MKLTSVIAIVVALLLCSPPARADLEVTALGSARVVAGNVDQARTRALDDAHKQAVEQAVGRLVSPQTLSASATAIRTRILRRARDFVTTFRVLEEGEQEGVYAIRIQAQVATGPLAAALAEAGVPVAGATVPPAAGRPRLVLLIVGTDGTSRWATFGKEARLDPASTALKDELTAAGFEATGAPGVRVPTPAPGQDGPDSDPAADAPPITEAQARAMATEAGAQIAVFGSITLGDGGAIRGTSLVGADAQLALHAVAVDGSWSWSGKCPGAEAGDSAAGAMEASGRAAARCLAKSFAARLVERWPVARPGGGDAVLVSARALRSWAPIEALVSRLAGTPGVQSVAVRRLGRGLVLLGIAGRATPDAVARVAREVTVDGQRLDAQVSGNVVEVRAPTPVHSLD